MATPTQPNPHAILTMSETQTSIKQWDYIPLPLNQMGHCNSLNQKNMAEAILHNFRGEIKSQDGICPVCTPSWP